MAKHQKESVNYWFKRRRYGWGWVPITWQGWVALIAFIGIVIAAAAIQLPAKPEQPSEDELIRFLIIFTLAVLILVAICMAKGPAPHWRWGKKPSDNPDEDL